MNQRLHTWLQLFRAPNLFTVLGDPLAGYLLANLGTASPALGLVLLASLCLYGSGLLLNDLVDADEDLRARPDRPLPSGRAGAASVRRTYRLLNLVAVALLAVAGTDLARFAARGSARTPEPWEPLPLLAGLAIIVLVWLYNRGTKRTAVVGALNMGACRAGNVFLGAAAGPVGDLDNALPAALFIGFYIAAVTNLARYETRQRAPLLARVLPVTVVLVGCTICLRQTSRLLGIIPTATASSAAFIACAAVASLLAVRLVLQSSVPLPPMIGSHIRLLLLIQAAFCWFVIAPSAWIAGCALVISWPLSQAVGKRFYGS